MSVAQYNEKKTQRREKQAATFQSIQKLPQDEWAPALFLAWPQRVPKCVWANLTRDQKHDWLTLRLKHIESLMIGDLIGDYNEFGRDALLRNRKGVQEILKLVQSVRGKKVLTVAFEDPFFDGEEAEEKQRSLIFSYNMDENGKVTSPTDIIPLESGIAISLCGSGGLSVRQEMTLKVQRTNAEGQQEWIPQERVYGIQIRDGRWSPVPADSMKRQYNTDSKTGAVIPPVAGLSFGDLSGAVKLIRQSTK